MKTISIALATHLAQPTTTLACCLTLTRTDGVIIRATNHDEDLVIDGQTFYARSGGTSTDVESSAALNVDNSELHALLTLDAITEADLRAGIYDGATVSRFLINYETLDESPSDGAYRQQDGIIGQVTVDRLSFIAELRGMMQKLQQSFGQTCTPTCPYTLGSSAGLALGDGDCTKDLGTVADSPLGFTRPGTAQSVSADGLTWTDSARTEPGPSGGMAITGISNAKPCVITTASALLLPNGAVVTLSGIVGPASLNGPVVIQNPSNLTFEIDLDTTNTTTYPPYGGSGGVVTPEGSEAGYFAYGLMTITGGPESPDSRNVGRTREIKSYVVGQWTLQEAFPYPVTGLEDYVLVAGCDKTASTCRTKFNNLANFGGFAEVPGQDAVVQVGRRE